MHPLQEPHVELMTRQRCRWGRARDERRLDRAVDILSETGAVKDHTEGAGLVSIGSEEREINGTHTPASP